MITMRTVGSSRSTRPANEPIGQLQEASAKRRPGAAGDLGGRPPLSLHFRHTTTDGQTTSSTMANPRLLLAIFLHRAASIDHLWRGRARSAVGGMDVLAVAVASRAVTLMLHAPWTAAPGPRPGRLVLPSPKDDIVAPDPWRRHTPWR
jgi:hypothetical protein